MSPTCPHDAVAMATAAACKWRIEHSAVTWPNIKIFKIQSGGRPPCWKILAYHNSLSNGPIGTKLGWWHPITFPTCPPKWGCHGNGRCLATALWTFSSYGRLEAERVNQFWWNLVYNSKFRQQWQSCDQILKVGGRSLLESIRNAITRLQMDRLGRNLGGRIPSCSQYWKNTITPLTMGPIGTTLG